MRILVMFFHFPPISGGGVVVGVDLVNNLAKNFNKIIPRLQIVNTVETPPQETQVSVLKE